MPVRLEKPWIPLTPEHVAKLPGHLGVYELADAAGEIVYIGVAGGRSLFGLKGALTDVLHAPPAAAAQPEHEPPTGASAEASSEAGGSAPREAPERAREGLEPSEPRVPSAAVVDAERPAAPRRGWWNRFVLKDE